MRLVGSKGNMSHFWILSSVKFFFNRPCLMQIVISLGRLVSKPHTICYKSVSKQLPAVFQCTKTHYCLPNLGSETQKQKQNNVVFFAMIVESFVRQVFSKFARNKSLKQKEARKLELRSSNTFDTSTGCLQILYAILSRATDV